MLKPTVVRKLFPTSAKKLLFIGIMLFVSLGGFGLILMTRAKAEPQNIAASTFGPNTFSVSFFTDSKTPAELIVADNKNFKNPVKFSDVRDYTDSGAVLKPSSRNSHVLTAKGLEPEKQYWYKIGTVFNESSNNELYTISTPKVSANTPAPQPIFGQVVDKNGDPLSNILIHVQAVQSNNISSSVITSYTQENGTYSLDLANLRSNDNSTYWQAEKNTNVQYRVTASSNTESFFFDVNDNKIAPVQTFSFKNSEASYSQVNNRKAADASLFSKLVSGAQAGTGKCTYDDGADCSSNCNGKKGVYRCDDPLTGRDRCECEGGSGNSQPNPSPAPPSSVKAPPMSYSCTNNNDQNVAACCTQKNGDGNNGTCASNIWGVCQSNVNDYRAKNCGGSVPDPICGGHTVLTHSNGTKFWCDDKKMANRCDDGHKWVEGVCGAVAAAPAAPAATPESGCITTNTGTNFFCTTYSITNTKDANAKPAYGAPQVNMVCNNNKASRTPIKGGGCTAVAADVVTTQAPVVVNDTQDFAGKLSDGKKQCSAAQNLKKFDDLPGGSYCLGNPGISGVTQQYYFCNLDPSKPAADKSNHYQVTCTSGNTCQSDAETAGFTNLGKCKPAAAPINTAPAQTVQTTPGELKSDRCGLPVQGPKVVGGKNYCIFKTITGSVEQGQKCNLYPKTDGVSDGALYYNVTCKDPSYSCQNENTPDSVNVGVCRQKKVVDVPVQPSELTCNPGESKVDSKCYSEEEKYKVCTGTTALKYVKAEFQYSVFTCESRASLPKCGFGLIISLEYKSGTLNCLNDNEIVYADCNKVVDGVCIKEVIPVGNSCPNSQSKVDSTCYPDKEIFNVCKGTTALKLIRREGSTPTFICENKNSLSKCGNNPSLGCSLSQGVGTTACLNETETTIQYCKQSSTTPSLISTLYPVLNNSTISLTSGQLVDAGKYSASGGITLNLVSPTTVNFYIDVNGNGIKDENEFTVTGQKYDLVKQSESFKYDMLNGWNALNLPFYKDNNVPYKASEIRSIAASQNIDISSIKKWEGKWVEYTVSNGALFGQDFSIQPNEGYFIRSNEKGTFNVFGTTPVTSVPMQLLNGWSLVGVAPGFKVNKEKVFSQPEFKDGIKAFELISVMNKIDPGINADNVTRYDSGVYQGVSYGNGNDGKKLQFGLDFSVVDQQAYFVRSQKKTVFAP